MSSGQKQCAMDDEDAAWKDRCSKLSKMEPAKLLEVIGAIKTEWLYLKSHEIPMTRTQHSRCDTISKLLEKLP